LSQQATIGRLSQVCDRWIYSACLCFGLDLDEQRCSGFTYGYSVYQAEYSRNLMFNVGAQMEKVFDRVVDRTRSRLDIPTLRTLFGAKQRPHRTTIPDLSPRLAALVETPRYDLTLFKVHFGLLTLKAYTKILMPLARRSRVAETGGASPADVVSPWRGLSPDQRVTLEPAPVGYSGLPPYRARVSDS
jgi:hypothetical protein